MEKIMTEHAGANSLKDDWLDAVINRYFYFNSWSEMRTNDRAEHDEKQDVKCGLAALHVGYGFITYKCSKEIK